LDTVQDFEDLLERREVRYLIIGGLAFIWVDLDCPGSGLES
jgi:hypothetical protein